LRDGDIKVGVYTGALAWVVGFGYKSPIVGEDVVYVKFDHAVGVGLDTNADGSYQMWTKTLDLVIGVSVSAAIDAYQQACTDFEAAQLALEKAKAAVQDARLNLRDALDGES